MKITQVEKNPVDGSERWLFCLINVLSYVRSQVMFQNYDMPISRWFLSVQISKNLKFITDAQKIAYQK